MSKGPLTLGWHSHVLDAGYRPVEQVKSEVWTMFNDVYGDPAHR
jgi:hypothetical protein